jgi:glutaconate CoA-transferase subunit A
VARTVIVTAEEIVEQLQGPVQIPAMAVTGVAHAPRGAWPTSCYPLYPVAGGEILRYLEVCAAGKFDEYLAGFLRFDI